MNSDTIWIAPHAVTRFCQRILDTGRVYAEGGASRTGAKTMTPAQFEAWLFAIKHARQFRTDMEVAVLLGVSTATLRTLRANGLDVENRDSDRRLWLACLALTEGLDLK
jgi:hypothetical protein